jgi:hypothetical protein
VNDVDHVCAWRGAEGGEEFGNVGFLEGVGAFGAPEEF